MSNKENKETVDTLEPQLQREEKVNYGSKNLISILRNNPETEETRFLLTPEACGLLTSGGWEVIMEQDAAVDISFDDSHYEEYGVKIVDRATALLAPYIITYCMPEGEEIRKMRPGATILCMNADPLYHIETAQAAMDMKITVAFLEAMYSHNEEFVFANAIGEIDGRSAIMYAEEALSFLGEGKGVLLGGVAGVTPCEVLLIGEGRRIYTAAVTAMKVGATVCVMDNDVSALQHARLVCGSNLVTSTLHPHVLCNKIKSADVVIMDACTNAFEMPASLKGMMKDNVYVLDFQKLQPSVCVPRTVAMALSNIMVNFLHEMMLKNGMPGLISTTPGVQTGILIYDGIITDKLLGTLLHLPSTDISIMLTGTN